MPQPSSPKPPAALGDKKKAGDKTGVPSRIPEDVLPAIIGRYLNGELIEDMATEIGVTKKALYKRLHKFMLASEGIEFADLITQSLAERIADADQELEEADSMLEVSKWSQLGKFRRMDFERKRPGLYGQKPVLTIATIDVSGALEEKMEAVLERMQPRVIDDDAG